jgi:hypothetical protein
MGPALRGALNQTHVVSLIWFRTFCPARIGFVAGIATTGLRFKWLVIGPVKSLFPVRFAA